MLNVDITELGYWVMNTNSSAIASFSFQFTQDSETGEIIDEELGTLCVSFRGDEFNHYYYNDFNVSTFFRMVSSESIGRFFNERVRNAYQAITY